MARRTRVKRIEETGRIWVNAAICRPGEPDEELEDEEELLVRTFQTDPAYVRIGAGVTKKIRDYESLRVDVGGNIPCYMEQMDDQSKALADWVAERLDTEIDKWLGKPEEDEDYDPPPRTRKKKSKKKSRSKTQTRKRRVRRNT